MTDQRTQPPMDTKPMSSSSIRSGPLGIARVIIGLFSGTGERDLPSQNKKEHVRLVTIAQSHYCEKARWALDILEEDPKSPFYYTEDGHPPAFAAFETLAASKGNASVTPMIIFSDKQQVIYKSDAILKQLCPFLYPKDIEQQVIVLEEDLGNRLGASLRCFAYHHLLSKDYYESLAQLLTLNCSKVEQKLFTIMLDKGIDKGMRKFMNISDETAEVSEKNLRQIFEEMSKRLEESNGNYIMDTKDKKFGFTAVDLTFAALSYPFLRPDCMADFVIAENRLPPAAVNLSQELKATVAGKHVLKMYEKHRPVTKDGLVHVKSCCRDRIPWKELACIASVIGAITFTAALAMRRNY